MAAVQPHDPAQGMRRAQVMWSDGLSVDLKEQDGRTAWYEARTELLLTSGRGHQPRYN